MVSGQSQIIWSDGETWPFLLCWAILMLNWLVENNRFPILKTVLYGTHMLCMFILPLNATLT